MKKLPKPDGVFTGQIEDIVHIIFGRKRWKTTSAYLLEQIDYMIENVKIEIDGFKQEDFEMRKEGLRKEKRVRASVLYAKELNHLKNLKLAKSHLKEVQKCLAKVERLQERSLETRHPFYRIHGRSPA
jgi:hypothetical protein